MKTTVSGKGGGLVKGAAGVSGERGDEIARHAFALEERHERPACSVERDRMLAVEQHRHASGRKIGFQARSVLGGFFVRFLEDWVEK